MAEVMPVAAHQPITLALDPGLTLSPRKLLMEPVMLAPPAILGQFITTIGCKVVSELAPPLNLLGIRVVLVAVPSVSLIILTVVSVAVLLAAVRARLIAVSPVILFTDLSRKR
jgi:hypothetical protein